MNELQSSHTLPRSGRAVVRIREPSEADEPQRPVSLYDNLNEAGVSQPELRSAGVRVPSQAIAMSTTVPQNMAAHKIEGRHTPTRSSLRHSRMIVMSKQGKVPRKYLPHVLKRHRLAKSLLALQLLMGVAISTVAAWLVVWAPNLPTRDIPYWSGLPALFSAVLGLILICSCRKEYPGMPLACYVFTFKIVSVLVSLVGAAACFCASGFGIVHLVWLYGMVCEPANVLNASCACRSPSGSRTITYKDLNCPEVSNILTVLLIGSSAANAIAGFLGSWYVYLHWTSRYSNIYSQVRTNDNRPIIITNKM